jgi:hypothetical protein
MIFIRTYTLKPTLTAFFNRLSKAGLLCKRRGKKNQKTRESNQFINFGVNWLEIALLPGQVMVRSSTHTNEQNKAQQTKTGENDARTLR